MGFSWVQVGFKELLRSSFKERSGTPIVASSVHTEGCECGHSTVSGQARYLRETTSSSRLTALAARQSNSFQQLS